MVEATAAAAARQEAIVAVAAAAVAVMARMENTETSSASELAEATSNCESRVVPVGEDDGLACDSSAVQPGRDPWTLRRRFARRNSAPLFSLIFVPRSI